MDFIIVSSDIAKELSTTELILDEIKKIQHTLKTIQQDLIGLSRQSDSISNQITAVSQRLDMLSQQEDDTELINAYNVLIEKCYQALYQAIKREDNINAIKYLMSKGLVIDTNNYIPILLCAKYDRLEMLKYLLGQGINIYVCASEALDISLHYKHHNVSEYLMIYAGRR